LIEAYSDKGSLLLVAQMNTKRQDVWDRLSRGLKTIVSSIAARIRYSVDVVDAPAMQMRASHKLTIY